MCDSEQTLSVTKNKSKDFYCESVSLLKSLSLKSSPVESTPNSISTTDPPAAKKRKSEESQNLEEDDSEIGKDFAEDENDDEKCTIFGGIENIIENAVYLAVKFTKIEMPKMVKIDPARVSELKESIKRAPDKTQCIVGLIKRVDEEGDQVGSYQCWVNGELYVALMEIEMESDSEEQGYVLAVIHTVNEKDGIDSAVVGSFLLNNSKEFAAKLHQNLSYQDLLRFACVTLTSENSERTKTFLKTTLRGFEKGNKNVSFFIKFACLPLAYLNKFETFCRLFEDGSLQGMQLSYRQRIRVGKESKKKECLKLEIPLKFLKSHLKVSHEIREKLLDLLLEKKITFQQYKLELDQAAELPELKSHIEKISGLKFEDVKMKDPILLSDEFLSQFSGAKTTPTGQNTQYLKLSNHVKVILSSGEDDELNKDATSKVSFKESDRANIGGVNKIVKEHDVVVMVKGSDKNFNDKFEFAMREHVLGNSSIGIFIDPSVENVRNGLEHLEEDKPEIKVEAVFLKKEKPVVKGGFRSEYFPVFVMGNMKLFKDKEISNLFLHTLKDAIPLLLQQIVVPKSKLLFAFSDENSAIDLDPNNVLRRRDVSVCYMSSKKILDKIKTKIEKKIIN